MIYKFDKKSLLFIKDKKRIKIMFGSLFLVVVGSFMLGRYLQSTTLNNLEIKFLAYEKEEAKLTEEKFISMLKQYHIKHPHIVMAQAIVESNLGKSLLFRTNHNLFGMREAKQRLTNAIGTEHNHAFYNTWKESVIDYALYQASYMSNLNETQYFQALDESYAEAGHAYSVALKNIIKKHNLRSKF